MQESQIVKLFLIIGIAAVVLNVFSIFVIEGFSGKAFTDFLVPDLCAEENGTYYLSTPTSSTFCKELLDNAIDTDEMQTLCRRYYADGERSESCAGLALLYGRRIDDCMSNTFSLGRNKTTSVVPAEVEECCSVLATASAEGGRPTGLLMQAIFQDITGRKTKG